MIDLTKLQAFLYAAESLSFSEDAGCHIKQQPQLIAKRQVEIDQRRMV